jgi:outer membrane lipoprotein-sorting protein
VGRTATRLAVLCAAVIAVMTNAAADSSPEWQPSNPDDLFQRSRAVYAELRSYADTGSVTVEYGTSSTDRHTFATSFIRTPRHFLLDFNNQTGDRYVVWGNPDAFHTWWKATNQRFDYPNPSNTPAISQSGRNTSGVVLKVPTLLYAKAALGSDFANLAGLSATGSEIVGGRQCHRLTGKTSDTYGASAREVNARTMTVSIDAESLLIRKVVEEWPALPGQRNRTITTYQPQANPTLDPSRISFTPPSKQ